MKDDDDAGPGAERTVALTNIFSRTSLPWRTGAPPRPPADKAHLRPRGRNGLQFLRKTASLAGAIVHCYPGWLGATMPMACRDCSFVRRSSR